jgi:hypothetical protein
LQIALIIGSEQSAIQRGNNFFKFHLGIDILQRRNRLGVGMDAAQSEYPEQKQYSCRSEKHLHGNSFSVGV